MIQLPLQEELVLSSAKAWSNGRSLWADHRVIPMIPLLDNDRLWKFWPDIKCDSIAVSYTDLIQNRPLYTRARTLGIKEALGFNGSVTSVLMGDNWLLDSTSVEEYCEDVMRMGFDAATTSDDYVYTTDPENYRWSRLHKVVDRARKMKAANPSADLVGMAQGSRREEILFVLRTFNEIGIHRVAYPCAGYLSQRTLTPVREFLKIGREFGMWLWLVGVNSIRTMQRLDADACSGKGWSYRASQGAAYVNGSLRKTNLLHCTHQLCRDYAKTWVEQSVRFARHNILCLLDADVRMRREHIGRAQVET